MSEIEKQGDQQSADGASGGKWVTIILRSATEKPSGPPDIVVKWNGAGVLSAPSEFVLFETGSEVLVELKDVNLKELRFVVTVTRPQPPEEPSNA